MGKETFELHESLGRTYVLIEPLFRGNNYPSANWNGTHKALCGVLKKGQSLDSWIKNRNKKLAQ